jgi:hypothetical protein
MGARCSVLVAGRHVRLYLYTLAEYEARGGTYSDDTTDLVATRARARGVALVPPGLIGSRRGIGLKGWTAADTAALTAVKDEVRRAFIMAMRIHPGHMDLFEHEILEALGLRAGDYWYDRMLDLFLLRRRPPQVPAVAQLVEGTRDTD